MSNRTHIDNTSLMARLINQMSQVHCDTCNQPHDPIKELTIPRQFQVLHFCSQRCLEEFAQWRWSEPDRCDD